MSVCCWLQLPTGDRYWKLLIFYFSFLYFILFFSILNCSRKLQKKRCISDDELEDFHILPLNMRNGHSVDGASPGSDLYEGINVDTLLSVVTWEHNIHLHWLPVRRWVEFKLACLVHRALCGQMPIYLADDIHLISEGNRRSLRSSSDNMCAVPRTHNSFGDRSFGALGPRIWNSLPRGLRTWHQLQTF